MAKKKKSALQRMFDSFFGPKRVPTPKAKKKLPPVPRYEAEPRGEGRRLKTIDQRLLDHLLSEYHSYGRNVNERTVIENISLMTEAEKHHALTLSGNALTREATTGPDRENDEGDPVNPFWYH